MAMPHTLFFSNLATSPTSGRPHDRRKGRDETRAKRRDALQGIDQLLESFKRSRHGRNAEVGRQRRVGPLGAQCREGHHGRGQKGGQSGNGSIILDGRVAIFDAIVHHGGAAAGGILQWMGRGRAAQGKVLVASSLQGLDPLLMVRSFQRLNPFFVPQPFQHLDPLLHHVDQGFELGNFLHQWLKWTAISNRERMPRSKMNSWTLTFGLMSIGTD